MRFELAAIASPLAFAAALLLAASSVAQEPDTAHRTAEPGAPGRGQLLYDTYCVQCHTSQIHWRDARAARDWTTLRAQVERWQGQTGNNWPDEDIDAVAKYLNDTIYRYPDPHERG